jgi:hypothetical protein
MGTSRKIKWQRKPKPRRDHLSQGERLKVLAKVKSRLTGSGKVET